MLRPILSLAFVAVLASSVNASIIYSQAPSIGGPPYGAISMNDNFIGLGQYYRAYDNFQLSSDFSVTDVHWFGQYTEIGFGTSDFGNITRATAFDFLFYSDVAGAPGLLLQQETVSIAQANETFLGTAGTVANMDGVEFNHYDADLPNAFAGLAGVTYWLAIVADLPTSDNNFYDWHFGVPGDGVGFQDFDLDANGTVDLGEGRFGPPQGIGDFAFELTSAQTVPEPTSMAVWAVGGAIGLCFALRRRRRLA